MKKFIGLLILISLIVIYDNVEQQHGMNRFREYTHHGPAH